MTAHGSNLLNEAEVSTGSAYRGLGTVSLARIVIPSLSALSGYSHQHS
jgi:hypothetical protein